MVDIDRIQEEGLTSEEVLDRYTAQPQEEVEWVPIWDDNPEERPGENTEIKDGVLMWDNGEFHAELESYETTHWLARVDIPEWVGEFYPRVIDLKCHSKPEYGFIRTVEQDGYVATRAELVINEIRQPVFEVNGFIDSLRDSAEHSQGFMDNLERGMEVAEEAE